MQQRLICLQERLNRSKITVHNLFIFYSCLVPGFIDRAAIIVVSIIVTKQLDIMTKMIWKGNGHNKRDLLYF